jgi:hypothetical protein
MQSAALTTPERNRQRPRHVQQDAEASFGVRHDLTFGCWPSRRNKRPGLGDSTPANDGHRLLPKEFRACELPRLFSVTDWLDRQERSFAAGQCF